jgi:hypothetical protein
MSDPMKQAWRDVEEGFSALGQMMRDRYQGTSAGPADEPEPTTHDPGAALRDAFEQLVTAGRELGERAADVVRDDDVKAQVKRAAASLNDALAATVEMIGDQVTGLFKRPHDAEPAAEPAPEIPKSEPTADDARQ